MKNKKAVEEILDSVCGIAREHFESCNVAIQKQMEDLHQEDANKGRGFQGATIKNYIDLVEKELVDASNYLSSQFEDSLTSGYLYYPSIEAEIQQRFKAALPKADEYLHYLRRFPPNTGNPEYYKPKINEIEKAFETKRDKLAWAYKEKSRQLSEKLKNSSPTSYDRLIRYCKDRPYFFIPYHVFLVVAALKGLADSIKFIMTLTEKF